MADVEIKVKIDGVEYTQSQLKDLAAGAKKATKETKDLGKETKKAGEEATIFDDIKGKFSDMTSGVRKVIGSMKTLRGAIAATGIGLLITAFASLIAYFKTSEEGSRKLAIATETLSVLFGKLTEFASGLGEKLVNTFKNPKQALLDFGDLLKSQIVNRVKGMLELLPALGKAISLAFKGKFKEASTTAGNALGKVLLGVEDVVGKTIELGKAAVRVYKEEIVPAVQEAIAVATQLVDQTRALRDQQQELIVTNAELNKELETQQRIAEDTTRTYDERKAALERAAEAQVKLAQNVADQAKNEEALLKLQIQNESNYEKREELETQLAEATAARIDAETALETKRLEQAKITIELDQEELERKRSINDIIQGLELERLVNARERALKELEISENAALAELDNLKATEEEKQKIREHYANARKQVNDEANNAEAEDAQAVFAQIASGYEEGTAMYKAFKIAETTMATYVGAQKAYNSALEVPVIGNILAPIAAATAVASGLKSIQAIAAVQVPKAAYGGMITGASHSGGGQLIEAEGGEYIINKYAMRQPGVADIAQSLNNTATPSSNNGGSVFKTYVVASEVTTAQEADTKIKNLSRL